MNNYLAWALYGLGSPFRRRSVPTSYDVVTCVVIRIRDIDDFGLDSWLAFPFDRTRRGYRSSLTKVSRSNGISLLAMHHFRRRRGLDWPAKDGDVWDLFEIADTRP